MDNAAPAPPSDATHAKPRTGHAFRLVSLRWLSIGVMLTLAVVAAPLLKIRVPSTSIFLVAAALTVWNVVSIRRLGVRNDGAAWPLFLEFTVDLGAWAAFLYLTGGATNPLISLLLPLIAVGAAVLPARHAWGLALLSIGVYSWLWTHHLPLDLLDSSRAVHWHLAGMWGTFALSALVIVLYVSRMTSAVRARDRALAAEREVRLRNERIVAIANMAAAAAHELGTPLATMKLLVSAMEDRSCDAEETEDIALMHQQIDYCKTILLRFTEVAGRPRADSSHAQPAAQWLTGLLDILQSQRLDLVINRNFGNLTAGIVADTSLDHALNNLINNAARAAPDNVVDVSVQQRDQLLELNIADRGKGIPAEVLETLSTPATQRRLPTEGLGIGLMLTIASIEQHGGSLEYMNRAGGGTIARVTLPVQFP